MKRLLTAARMPAAITAAVLALLITGGGYALATSLSRSITVCIRHHGGAIYKAGKCAPHDHRLTFARNGPAGRTGPAGARGATGATGAQGAAGSPGTTGTPGTPGFVSLAGWAGAIVTVPATTTFAFVGPTATVTTTSTQAISASGSAALGISTGTSDIELAICVEPSAGGTISALDPTPGAFQDVTVTTTRSPFPSSMAGVPGAGTWLVGVCVVTPSALNVDDWSVGQAFVVNASSVKDNGQSVGKSKQGSVPTGHAG